MLEEDVVDAVGAGDEEEDNETLRLLRPEDSRGFDLRWFAQEILPMKMLEEMLLRGRLLLRQRNDA